MAVIFEALSESDVYDRYGSAIELLHWILVRLRDPYIKSINKESVSSFADKYNIFVNFKILFILNYKL